MKQKATIPVIVIAVIGLIAFVLYMSRSLGPPEATHTAPPPWIDPATGAPKAGVKSTSGPSGAAPTSSGKPAGGQ